MATTNENIKRNNPYADTAKALYSWSVMGMLSKGATQGYHVPGMGAIGAGANKLSSMAFGANPQFNTSFKFGSMAGDVGKSWSTRMGKFSYREIFKRMGTTKSAAMKTALGKLAISRTAGLALSAIQWYFGATLLAAGGSMFNAYANRVRQQRSTGIEGGNFYDTTAGATSRQRALRAISSSRLQARSAIGMEAQLFHR